MSSRTYFTMKNIVDNNFKVETLRLRFSAASTDVQRFEEFFHDILATKFFAMKFASITELTSKNQLALSILSTAKLTPVSQSFEFKLFCDLQFKCCRPSPLMILRLLCLIFINTNTIAYRIGVRTFEALQNEL